MKTKCYCGKDLSEHYEANGDFGSCLDGFTRCDPMGCPGCSGKAFTETNVKDIVVCERCGGIISKPGTAVPERSTFFFVKPRMKGADDKVMERSRYYDFTILCDDGKTDRIHGWYDPADGLITQVG